MPWMLYLKQGGQVNIESMKLKILADNTLKSLKRNKLLSDERELSPEQNKTLKRYPCPPLPQH